MSSFWSELESARSRWNVLEHPFYQRWSEGELTVDELGIYAGQYRHAVEALAEVSTAIVDQVEPELTAQLAKHAAEEVSHLQLWDDFARGLDHAPQAPATAETRRCAEVWSGLGSRTLEQNLVAIYAIESGQPEISATKLAGLCGHYGFEEGSATEYFSLHAELDREHAREARALIEPLLEDADCTELVNQAEAVWRANWELLDGVEQLCGRAQWRLPLRKVTIVRRRSLAATFGRHYLAGGLLTVSLAVGSLACAM